MMGRSPVWQNSQSPRIVPAAARGPPVSSVKTTSTSCFLNKPASTPIHVTLWKAARSAIAVRVSIGAAALAAFVPNLTPSATAAAAALPKRLRVIKEIMFRGSGSTLVSANERQRSIWRSCRRSDGCPVSATPPLAKAGCWVAVCDRRRDSVRRDAHPK